jgi:hypothetical protein
MYCTEPREPANDDTPQFPTEAEEAEVAAEVMAEVRRYFPDYPKLPPDTESEENPF